MHGVEAVANKVSTNPEPDRMPEIEAMCGELAELRSHTARLEDQARTVEVRILGPIPADEGSPPNLASVSCLTGVVGSDLKVARNALRGVERSLDRIVEELGSIGNE